MSSGVTGSGSGAALALWWSAQDITAAALVQHTGDIMLHTNHSTVLCMLCSTQSSVCLGLQQGYGMQLGSPQCHCMPRYLSRHGVKYHLCQRVPELYRDYAMACHGCAMCQKTMVDPICHICASMDMENAILCLPCVYRSIFSSHCNEPQKSCCLLLFAGV